MIEAVNLTKYYPPPIRSLLDLKSLRDFLRTPREEISALVDISFEVNEGEIYGLLGPNGAGKTTLCKIANGLVIPTRGHLYIDGHDSISEHDKIRGKLFTIFGGDRDLFGLFQWRVSVEKNLRFIAELWGIPKLEADKRINYALRLLNLKEKRKEWYQKLSAGMRQKVYLALPFIIQPEVLILDEPTVYLDIFTRREVWNAILELSREMETTVLLTTHNLNEAERLCDRILFFNKRKIAEGKPQELVEKVQALKAERKLIAKIKGKVKIDEFNKVVQKIEVQSDGKLTYLQLYFMSDDLREVLSLLSKYDVVDIQNAPITLEEVFVQLCK
ncbi:ABC transporter ATP-binding protein, partial [Thermococcus sp.]